MEIEFWLECYRGEGEILRERGRERERERERK